MPIQNTTSSVPTAALGPEIVMFEASCCRPKVNGGPIKRIEVRAVSVQTRISRLVSTACTKVEPAPRRRSPAVLVADGNQSIGFS